MDAPTPGTHRSGTLLGRATVMVVWTCWALMLAGNLLFSAKYSNPFPGSDEWGLLASLPEPVTLEWAWAQYSEHRVPLAKLLWIGVLQVTDYDFRLGNFLSVLFLATAAFAMVRTARELRGRTVLTDAFFPLALLSFGQHGNITWWWTVNHLLPPLAACGLLVAVVLLRRSPAEPGAAASPEARYAVGAAGWLALLPLCGPGGLPYVVLLAPWLGWWGVRQWWAGRRAAGGAVLASSALGVALVAFYFVGYESAKSFFPDPPSLGACLEASVQLLSVGLGTASKSLYWLWGGGIVVLGLLGAAALLVAWLCRPPDRFRIAGLLIFGCAAAGLVLVVGRSRAVMGAEYIFSGTYLMMIAPLLCCLYLLWEVIAAPATLARAVQLVLLAAVCALFVPNLQYAIKECSLTRASYRSFEDDIRKGLPSYLLAEKHLLAAQAGYSTWDAEVVSPLFHELARRGARQFKLRPEPPHQLVAVPALPANAAALTIENGVIRDVGGASPPSGYLEYHLGEPRFVCAVRIRYTYLRTATIYPQFRMFWSQSGRNEFTDDGSSEERSFSTYIVVDPGLSVIGFDEEGKVKPDASYAHAERPQTVLVHDTIDRIRIYPDATPCDFRIARVELYVPATPESAQGPAHE